MRLVSGNTRADLSISNAMQAAREHHQAGRLVQAEAGYRQILQARPDNPDALHYLGVIASQAGKNEIAIELMRKAINANPSSPSYYNNLGNVLNEQRRFDEAIASCRKALSLKPDYAIAHNNLGNALKEQGKLNEAATSYRQAITLKPDYAEAHNNLGVALKEQGKLDEAVVSHRRALSVKPDYFRAHTNLLFLYAYHGLLAPHDYLSVARDWEKSCLPARDRQVACNRVIQRLPLAGRRLRVGYVSGDYREHATSYFVEQLFRHHDRARVEVFAYSTRSRRDATTARLQALADHWVLLMGMSDAAIRERVEADGIDVLIDLSGHTAHHRLGVFALRAAPVQAHYLGFFASTGLTEMDYWIGDEILTPAATDGHFSEQVWRLPRTWVSYEGKADAPLPDWRPAQDGSVWLGSFNGLGKLTPATLALWAQVLHALPEGRLLLKTQHLAHPGNRQRILEAMAGHGIASSRIELQDSSITPGWPAHMAYYNRLDIALDPVGGVGGGTTTCDALWMAVPVVTLIGDRMASRMTASMLNAMGRPEWIARSETEYIDKVVVLARAADQRRELRLTQRSQVSHSPLCNAEDLAIKLESAYADMFEHWLAAKNEPIRSAPQNDAA